MASQPQSRQIGGMMVELLLVPGLNCTAALFAPQITALQDIAACHVPDQGIAASLEEIAATILVTAPERFALAGLSMGGYVAFEIIRQAPQRVTRLCLIDTRAAMDTTEEADRRRESLRLAADGRFSELHAILWPKLVHSARLGDRTLEDVVLTMMRDTGPERFARQQTAVLNRRDYRAVLESIAVPATIIVGAQDAITPPNASRAMLDLIRGARLLEIANCGHLSTLERPEEVSAALRRWLIS
jgi:pimeloyl-ACP methyl ester carboxylesterase